MAQDWQQTISRSQGTPNPHLGTRFDAEGRFLAEHGNTVVAAVAPGSPTETALLGLRQALQVLPHGDHFAFTEPASYHMTVFEGVVETRRAPGFWPQDLPLDLPIEAVTARMAARLQRFTPPPAFRMRITAVTPFGLRLAGATPADETAARAWRDGLSGQLGLRTPQHANYGFHITLAYVVRWLPTESLPAYREAMARLTDEIVQQLPSVDLARPAFCRFADMNGFAPLVRL